MPHCLKHTDTTQDSKNYRTAELFRRGFLNHLIEPSSSVRVSLLTCQWKLLRKIWLPLLHSLPAGICNSAKTTWSLSSPCWILSALSFFLYKKSSGPLNIYMALSQTCSSKSVSLFPCAGEPKTGHSTPDITQQMLSNGKSWLHTSTSKSWWF